MTANFVAGGYSYTFNAKALGQSAEGLRFEDRYFKRIVTGDLQGDTPQDAIHRGRDVRVNARLIEALETGIPDLIEPYHASVGTQGIVGLLDVRDSKALSLVMTAIAGTQAAANPATRTCPLTMIAEDFPIDILFGPDLREVPISLRVYMAAATGIFYTET